MSDSEGLRALPAFVALDAYPVLEELRRGASFQLNETYFNGQLRILQALDSVTGFENRVKTLKQSLDLYNDITIDIETLNRENLLEASQRFRDILQQLPEIMALQNTFPGTCMVVPEWLRTEQEVKYGARVYLFRADDAPDPDEIIRKNVESIITEDQERFDRYRGRLHGYPDCCIRFLHDRISDSPPETRSVEPFSKHVNDDLLENHENTSASISQIVSDFSSTDEFYSFFARAFYPESGCETAISKGREIYEEIADSFSEALAEDHFRLNFGISYMRGRGVLEGAKSHPTPGVLGREHLYFYLPLQSLQTLSRYT